MENSSLSNEISVHNGLSNTTGTGGSGVRIVWPQDNGTSLGPFNPWSTGQGFGEWVDPYQPYDPFNPNGPLIGGNSWEWSKWITVTTTNTSYFTIVSNTDKEQVIQVDIPGVKKTELKLGIINGNLNLETTGKRSYTALQYLGFLPGEIRARLEDGVLTITMQKVQATKIVIE